MKKLQMNKYGKFLTGREFGKSAMKRIAKDIEYPVYLDFEGVTSIADIFCRRSAGSHSKKPGEYSIQVINVKNPVWECIQVVAEDRGFTATKKDL